MTPTRATSSPASISTSTEARTLKWSRIKPLNNLVGERSNINAAYTTMPEYGKFARIIDELRPSCPLLLVGIRIATDAT